MIYMESCETDIWNDMMYHKTTLLSKRFRNEKQMFALDPVGPVRSVGTSLLCIDA